MGFWLFSLTAFNLLLQLLEDGRLTDSQGRVVDFKNTLIIIPLSALQFVTQKVV